MADNPGTSPESEPTSTEADLPEITTEAEVTTSPEAGDTDVETTASDSESEPTTESEESYFIELDGEEIDLDDIREWRAGHMKDADYRQKTAKVADERRELEAKGDEIAQKVQEIDELRDKLKVLVMEDEQTDWEGLKDSDPQRYIEHLERNNKRKELLEQIDIDPSVDIEAEKRKLFEANPQWVEKGKATDAYHADMKLMGDYTRNAGYTQRDIKGMTKAHFAITVLKAAKYDQLQAKTAEVKKERKKVPVVTKPKAKAARKQAKTPGQLLYGVK